MAYHPIRQLQSIKILAVAILLTLSVYTSVVVFINLNLRSDIKEQILNRDAEIYYLFSMMDRSGASEEDITEIATPWIYKNNSLTPSLWTSDLKGIVALQVFDTDGALKDGIPDTLIPAALSDKEIDQLKNLKLISKFHEQIWLYSLFDDTKYLFLETPVPLLEVIIPVHSAESSELEAIFQYWIDGNSMLKEMEQLNRNIAIQMTLALSVGYLIILSIFTWMYRQIRHNTEKLRKSEEQLTTAQRISKLGSWEWDARTNRILCSEETARILRIDPLDNPVKLRTFRSRFHEDDMPTVKAELKKAFSGQSRVSFEHRLQFEEHPTRYVRQQARFYYNKRKKITRVLGTIQDLTSEKAAEKETQRLRDMLSEVVNSMPIILLGVNKNGQVTLWNREAEVVTGLTRKGAQNKLLIELLPQLNLPHKKLDHALKEGEIVRMTKVDIEFNSVRDLYDVTIYPLVSMREVIGGVVLLANVSERSRLEDMMVQVEKMRNVGGLAAGMAHEINNPLAAIVQSLQVLQNRMTVGLAKNETVALECGTTIQAINDYIHKRGLANIIQNISNEGKRASKIVINMLNFSRKSTQVSQKVHLANMMDKSIELASNEFSLKKKYDFRSIKIIREYDPDTPEAFCEANSIQQVFLNVLGNGAQAMNKETNIEFNPQFIIRILPEDEEYVRVEIEDNGPGMDELTRSRAFEPFYTTKSVGEGTGLGLSVSFYIISENNGSITIESEKGKGTKFIILLPVSPQKSGIIQHEKIKIS